MNPISMIAEKLRSLAEQAEEFHDIQKSVETRDQSFSDIYWAVDDLFWMAAQEDFDGYHYLRDMFVDRNGDMFAITISDGKMFRSPVSLNDLDEPVIGDQTQVTMSFEPVGRSTIVSRNSDGIYHALAILSTSVVNKDGEIDSTELHDTMIDRFQGNERVNFHHTDIEFGTVRSVWRDEHVMWGHLEFDDTALGRAAAEGLSDEWGISYEFFYDESTDKEIIEVDGVSIPVYTAGTLSRASILKSNKAASWFTAIPSVATKERTTMNQTIKKDFEELLGEDNAALAEQMSDGINNRAVDEGMIRRDADTVIDVDDDLLGVMTETVTTSEPWVALTGTMSDIQAQFAEVMTSIESMTNQFTMTTDQIAGELREVKERLGVEEGERAKTNASKPPAQRSYVYKPTSINNNEPQQTTKLTPKEMADRKNQERFSKRQKMKMNADQRELA